MREVSVKTKDTKRTRSRPELFYFRNKNRKKQSLLMSNETCLLQTNAAVRAKFLF